MRCKPLACERLALVLCAGALLSIGAVAHAHAPGVDKPLPALREYLALGIEHILGGLDHLAFLLGLTLSVRSLRAVLAAVTAFTLAHSLSLGLCVMGIVAPPSRWIEVAIALSIAYVALENRFAPHRQQRYRIGFVFGFIHGFGFAGALQEIGVPSDAAPAALALFNLGVEAGQIAVLSLIVPGLRWLQQRPRWSVPALHAVNVALVVLGLGWAAQRVWSADAEPATGMVEAVPRSAAAAPVLVSTQRGASQLTAAKHVCDLFMRLPRERRAQCTGEAVGVTFEQACTRALDASLAAGGLVLAAEALPRCEEELRAHYADCSSATQPSKPAAPSCSRLWAGRLAAGDTCRSSLECRTGLQCRGVGPFDDGVCAAPSPPGAACGRSIDPLANYLQHADEEHAECQGSCVQGRCR